MVAMTPSFTTWAIRPMHRFCKAFFLLLALHSAALAVDDKGLVCAQETAVVHSDKESSHADATWTLTNQASSRLIISSTHAECSCVEIHLDKTQLDAGSSATLTARVSYGLQAVDTKKPITVDVTNATTGDQFTRVLYARVIAPAADLTIEPESPVWDLHEDFTSKTLTITSPEPLTFHWTCASGNFLIAEQRSSPGRLDLRITPTISEKTPCMATLEFTSDSKQERLRAFKAFAIIR